MLSEFELIARYFDRRSSPASAHTVLGIGDDCALLAPSLGQQLAISSDMLVAGRHFFHDTHPEWLGHKALAVNLSDLAAMGAQPVAFTLALALPSVDEAWLASFAHGLFALADSSACALIGGDTTKGPLNICITVFGHVPPQQALRRSGAQVGDDIWISGSIGDARLALHALLGQIELPNAQLQLAQQRLHQPQARLALGCQLRNIAHAALDLSDGLLGDLQHILQASQVGAEIDLPALPVGAVLAQQPEKMHLPYMLAGGDDYELCFTAPTALRAQVEQAGVMSATPVTRVGRICAQPGLRFLDSAGCEQKFSIQSFDHFQTP